MTRRNALMLGGLIAVVGLGSWLLTARGEDSLALAPLDNVPHDTVAAAWIDVPAVLSSPLWERFVEARGGDRGVRRIERICGDNPLRQLSELIVFATGDAPEDLDQIGVVARGPFERTTLTECVRAVVENDGGTLRDIQLDGMPAVAGRGSSRAVFVGTDGVVGGDEPTVRRVLAAVRDEAPRLSSDRELDRLFGMVAPGSHAVAVGRLPQRWREAIRRWMSESVDADLEPLSSVRSLGVGVRVLRGFGASLVLVLDDEAACDAAAEAVRAQIAEALARPIVALSAAGPALRRVEVEPDGTELLVTIDLSPSRLEDLMGLADQLLDARAGDDRPPTPRPSAPRPPTPPEPDEVIRPNE